MVEGLKPHFQSSISAIIHISYKQCLILLNISLQSITSNLFPWYGCFLFILKQHTICVQIFRLLIMLKRQNLHAYLLNHSVSLQDDPILCCIHLPCHHYWRRNNLCLELLSGRQVCQFQHCSQSAEILCRTVITVRNARTHNKYCWIKIWKINW